MHWVLYPLAAVILKIAAAFYMTVEADISAVDTSSRSSKDADA